MRKHRWRIVLFQQKIPDFVRNAFPDVQQSHRWMNNTHVMQLITYDPITDAQLALLKRSALSLASDGIHSVSCSSEEVQQHDQQSTTEEASENYLYTFTLRGHVAVTEEQGEEIAYGWTKTALEDLALDPPENLQQQVKSFAISSVDLTLEDDEDGEDEGMHSSHVFDQQ